MSDAPEAVRGRLADLDLVQDRSRAFPSSARDQPTDPGRVRGSDRELSGKGPGEALSTRTGHGDVATRGPSRRETRTTGRADARRGNHRHENRPRQTADAGGAFPGSSGS